MTMTVYNTDTTRVEQAQKQMSRGRIPLVCRGDCESVGGVDPERLADEMDSVRTGLGIHEPCGEPMMIAPLYYDSDADEYTVDD